ncbi:hypothetical protein FRY74_09165 [Vicingus serpentipes]|uniref:Beta-carotene 15,15'-monooxygenase n=1 Tax=Vicingus serpentipes TaxID=1926625 RepID=A0A5C6RSJ5_9FLAO|nr:DUF6427 family protein [Vicingus serpentipes]TXB64610.1 hypothetical protein FRY74_09165 [Vicingus serpentipes]
MLLEIFKSNKSIVGVLVVILSIVLWMPGFFISQEVILKTQVANFNGIDFLFSPRWLNIIITSLLISGQAIYLNYIVSTNKLLKSNSFLVAVFYVLLNGAGLVLFSLNLLLVVNTLVLLLIHQLFKLYNLQQANATIFNVGFFLGLAVVLYNPFILLLPLAIFGIAYVRTPKGKDFLILIIGFLVPFIYWVTYLYLNNQLIFTIDNYLLFHSDKIDKVIIKNYYFLSFVSFLSILAIFNLILLIGRNVVKTRKLLMMVFLLMGVSALTYFFKLQDLRFTYLILIVPLSIILANFFTGIKKRAIGELAFMLLLVSIILDYFL